ncbi:hypothetical protein, partial [Candidatus Entotheonella palauensis]|uniref:hypothetical protein n=1 Tax=Candidatus Entotheonella palauensis TaxID=93172 RepID=UPI000B7EA696
MSAHYAALSLWMLSLVIGLLLGMPNRAHTGVISDRAYPLLTDRVSANRNHFFIYRDADSGFNHGVPSGFFAGPEDDIEPDGLAELIGQIDVDAACIDDPESPDGCTSDPARLDRERGTVIRITLPELTEGQFVGVIFEEPEGFTETPRGVGYNLSGVDYLVFDIRSPDHFRVRFEAGNSMTGFMDISANWTEMYIPIRQRDPFPDSTNVHRLFAVVAAYPEATRRGTILLDNIRYTPAPRSQRQALGLPLSTESFGVLPLQALMAGETIPSAPPDQANRNLAAIYEASLAVLALLERRDAEGQPHLEDLIHTQLIVDTLSYALQNDNQGALLPVTANGDRGLHNAYRHGDIALLNDQFIDREFDPDQEDEPQPIGLQGNVQLAGYSAPESICGPTRFCLVLDGATGGNNAFAMLAFLAAYRDFRNVLYLENARTIGRWIVDELTDRTDSAFGGYYAGFRDQQESQEAKQPPRSLSRGKSTENNAAIFSAFSTLAAVEQEAGNPDVVNFWRDRAAIAGDFVIRTYIQEVGCFGVGTFQHEETGTEQLNRLFLLDAQTIPILALATAPRYRDLGIWELVLECALNNFAQSIVVDGQTFEGFHMGLPAKTDNPPGIAWEFTAQVIAAMRILAPRLPEKRLAERIDFYLRQLEHAQAHAPFTDGMGLVASTRPEGERLPPREHCLPSPFQCIPMRVGLAATTWAIFADQGFNPLPQDQLSVPGLEFTPETAGGCTLSPSSVFDPMLAGLLVSVETIARTPGCPEPVLTYMLLEFKRHAFVTRLSS